jgi:hypothetical protein
VISPRNSDSRRRVFAGDKIDTWHPGLAFQRFAQRAVAVTLVVFAAALVGCGAPDQAKDVAVKADVRRSAVAPTSVASRAPATALPAEQATVTVAAGAHAIAAIGATAAAPTATPGTIGVPVRESAPAPFRLVGTSISDRRAFAFLKQPGSELVTVHEGDRVDGYTVAAIAPDRVKLESSDHAEQLLTLGAAAGATSSANEADPAPPAITGKVVVDINTDQSIPEHVTLGPTGSLPEGMKQMGH